MRIITVRTLDDALAALKQLGGSDPSPNHAASLGRIR
jgi:hypothetical protein